MVDYSCDYDSSDARNDPTNPLEYKTAFPGTNPVFAVTDADRNEIENNVIPGDVGQLSRVDSVTNMFANEDDGMRGQTQQHEVARNGGEGNYPDGMKISNDQSMRDVPTGEDNMIPGDIGQLSRVDSVTNMFANEDEVMLEQDEQAEPASPRKHAGMAIDNGQIMRDIPNPDPKEGQSTVSAENSDKFTARAQSLLNFTEPETEQIKDRVDPGNSFVDGTKLVGMVAANAQDIDTLGKLLEGRDALEFTVPTQGVSTDLIQVPAQTDDTIEPMDTSMDGVQAMEEDTTGTQGWEIGTAPQQAGNTVEQEDSLENSAWTQETGPFPSLELEQIELEQEHNGDIIEARFVCSDGYPPHSSPPWLQMTDSADMHAGNTVFDPNTLFVSEEPECNAKAAGSSDAVLPSMPKAAPIASASGALTVVKGLENNQAQQQPLSNRKSKQTDKGRYDLSDYDDIPISELRRVTKNPAQHQPVSNGKRKRNGSNKHETSDDDDIPISQLGSPLLKKKVQDQSAKSPSGTIKSTLGNSTTANGSISTPVVSFSKLRLKLSLAAIREQRRQANEQLAAERRAQGRKLSKYAVEREGKKLMRDAIRAEIERSCETGARLAGTTPNLTREDLLARLPKGLAHLRRYLMEPDPVDEDGNDNELLVRRGAINGYGFRQVIMSRSVSCGFCGSAFATHDGLAKHVIRAHGRELENESNNVECVLCNKKLRSEINLRRHVENVHNTEAKITCGICGAKFGSVHAHAVHRREVHGVGRRGSSSGSSPSMGTASTSVAPSVPTPPSGSTAVTAATSVNLASSKTPVNPEEELSGIVKPGNLLVVFRCMDCGIYTSSKGNVERHIQIKHLRLRPFLCCCGRRFPTKNNLQCHQTSKNCINRE